MPALMEARSLETMRVHARTSSEAERSAGVPSLQDTDGGSGDHRASDPRAGFDRIRVLQLRLRDEYSSATCRSAAWLMAGASIRLQLLAKLLRRRGVRTAPRPPAYAPRQRLGHASARRRSPGEGSADPSTGTFQMSRAYSPMARSEENQAMLATLRMLMRAQADADCRSWSTRRCAA